MPTIQAGFPVTDTDGAGATPKTISVTVNAGTNRGLFVLVEAELSTSFRSSVTYGGVALRRLAMMRATSFGMTDVWFMLAPPVGTANVVVTDNVGTRKVTGIYVVDDVDQKAPFRDAQAAFSDSATAASLTLNDIVSGDLLIDSLEIDGTGHVDVAGADQTNQYNIETLAGASTGVSSTQAGANGGVMSHSWTTAKPYSHIAFALVSPRSAAAGIIHSAPSAATGSTAPATMTVAPHTPGVGANPSTGGTTLWLPGAYVDLLPYGWSYDVALIDLTFQPRQSLGTTTTREIMFEIAKGAPGSEVVIAQVPYSYRCETAVAYYLDNDDRIVFPEPIKVTAGTRISVRVAENSTAAFAYDGVKTRFQELVSGPTVVTLGQVTETDLSQPITRVKARAVGQTTETEIAQPVARVKVRALGQVLETELAQPVAKKKVKAVGQPLDTEIAQPVTRNKVRAVGQVVATNTAQPVARNKQKTLGQTVETDSATRIILPQRVSVGQALEADLAQAITRRKVRLVAQAQETTSAQAVTRVHTRAVGQTVETDLAQAISRKKVRAANQALETDLAQAISARKVKAVGQTLDTEIAQPVTRVHSRTLGQAVETIVETAQPILRRKTKILGQVVETDIAQPFTRPGQLLRVLGQVTETDVAQTVTRVKRKVLGQGVDTSSAFAVVRRKTRAVQTVVESDVVFSISHRKVLALGQPFETDTAGGITGVLTPPATSTPTVPALEHVTTVNPGTSTSTSPGLPANVQKTGPSAESVTKANDPDTIEGAMRPGLESVRKLP